MNTNSFASKNVYLSNLDLINKYNLKSVYIVPNLQNVSLNLSLNTIVEACDFKNIVNKDHEIQIKSFLLLYITFLIIPFIKNNKIRVLKSNDKNLKMNYILKVVLINATDIHEFLFLIFVENWQQLLIDDNKLFKKSLKLPFYSNSIIFRTHIYLNNINDCIELISKLLLQFLIILILRKFH